MLRDRLFATTVYFMAPSEGANGGGALGGGSGASATPVGDGASSGAAVVDAAAATAPATAEAAAASESVSTPAGESASIESSPSLLSSAAGKTPDQPAPAADAKTEPDAKAAETPDGAKPGETPAKPDDPGKTSKPEGKADAATDPATKDATPAAAPAPVSIEDLKLPEGVSLDAEAGKALLDIVNNADLSRKDLTQGMLGLHQKEMERYAKHVTDNQRKVWDDLNAGWKDQLRKDPELGGNRLNTSLSMAKAVVEEFLSPEDAKALLVHTDNNGMGNFPVFIRLLHSIGKRMNVFEDGIVANAKAPAPAKGPGKRGWYDNTPGMDAR